MKIIRILLIALLAVMPVLGSSIIFPTYSTPMVVDGTVILLSSDRMELIGLSKAGKELWKQALSSKGNLITHASGKTLLAQGASISSVNPKDGTVKLLFNSEPPVEHMRYSAETNDP